MVCYLIACEIVSCVLYSYIKMKVDYLVYSLADHA